MNRRLLIAGFCAGLLAAPSAWAQGYADQIVRQLRQQGYSGISVTDTWLGRTRIFANSGNGSREIIIDPRTGEILRDLSQGGGGSGQRIIDDRDGSGSGRDGSGEDDTSDSDSGDRSGSGGGGDDPHDDPKDDDEGEND